MRLIIIAAAILALSGCGEKEIAEETNKTSQNVINNIEKEASEADEISQKTEEAAAQITLETKQTAANESGDTSQKANETLFGEKADKIINENTIEAVKADDAAKVIAPTNADKSKKLFMTCIPCHGAKAEKSAVNKSQIINKWSKEQILNALKGYKDGTYGGAFKAQMIPTAKRLNDADMEELSDYIVNLGKQ